MQSFQLSLLVTLFCLLITGCSQKEKSASGEPAKPLSDAQPSPPPSADSNKAPIENKKAFVTRQLQKLAEGETLQLSYPEEQMFNLLTSNLEGLKIDSSGKSIHWYADELSGGKTYEVRIQTAEDKETILTIEVAETNSAPVLEQSNLNSLLTLGRPFELQIKAKDHDFPENSLSYALQDAPNGISVDSTGRISGTLASFSDSKLQFRFKVTDNGIPAKSVEGGVTMIVGKEPPALVSVVHPAEPVAQGIQRVGFIVKDDDIDDQISVLNADQLSNLKIIQGPKTSALINYPGVSHDLKEHEWLITFDQQLSADDNVLQARIVDKFGYEVELSKGLTVNRPPVISNLVSSYTANSSPSNLTVGFTIRDSKKPIISFYTLNGEALAAGLKTENLVLDQMDGTYTAQLRILPSLSGDCAALSQLRSDNELVIKIDDGQNPVFKTINFQVPLISEPPVLLEKPIQFIAPNSLSYRLGTPYGYYDIDSTCQQEKKIKSFSPAIGTVAFDGWELVWAPGKDIRDVRTLSVVLEVENHISKTKYDRTVVFKFNNHPIRTSDNVAQYQVAQNGTVSFDLPFLEYDSTDPVASSHYQLRTYAKAKDSESYFVPTTRSAPIMTLSPTGTFSVDWKVECTDFSPGAYDVVMSLEQLAAPRQNPLGTGYLGKLDFPSDLNLIKMKLQVTASQPCSGLITTQRYKVLFNPEIGSKLVVSYTDGSEFLKKSFDTDRDLWVFDQDITSSFGRILNWTLTKNDQVVKSFQMVHKLDPYGGYETIDNVDYATVRVSDAISAARFNFRLEDIYEQTCIRNGYIWVPCTARVYKTGIKLFQLKTPAEIPYGQPYTCKKGTVDVKNLDKSEVSIGPLSYEACNW